MVETVEDAVAFIRSRFERMHEENAKLRRSLRGKDRDILIELTDAPDQRVIVADGRIVEAGEGSLDDPDVRVTLSRDDLLAVLNGELHPVTAYLTRRVRVKAPIRDVALVKGFL